MDDLLTEFLTETSESLAVLDVELVKFEQEPDNKEILGNIFRLVHTIKGTCGFLGLPRLESVAHAGENVLGKFRDGELDVTPEAVTLILKCMDCIRDLLGKLEETGQEPDGTDQELIDALNAHAEGGNAPKPAPQPAAEVASPASDGPTPTNEFGAPVAAELLAEVEAASAQGVQAASQEQLDAELAAEREAEAAMATNPATNEHGAPVAQELLAEVEAAQAAGARAATEAELKADLEKERQAEKAGSSGVPAPAASTEAEKKDTKGGGAGVAASSIRVNVDVLEDLMTLVSELVLTRNQLLQMVRGLDDSEFTVPLQRLSHITTDLQEGVMKTRMQPIGNAWAKLPRIVRDLAVESGKKIELVMLGAETELDRQVLELIKDPLTHMVRNSADHGLEDIEGRKEANKPETGTITLNAFHEGGHIIIEIADDGRGLNIDRIKQKALDNGLTTEADLEQMTDQQIGMFIFKAGFSTAEKITNVSGRGVGMDVVRTNIEKIGGTVELKTNPGKGSTFTIKIPLTLAIVSALIVECCGERFAVPQISVLELVRASAQSENAIEMINESAVLRLRDRLLPLISLRELLRLQDPPAAAKGNGAGAGDQVDDETPKSTDALVAEAIADDEEVFIVVTQVGSNTFGIIVDRVFDTEEIVVKPVAPILRDITFYSGNTILGDGSVIMILDPNGIAEAAGEMDTEHRSEADIQAVSTDEETTSLLVFRAGGPELKAVPLGLVARLEEVDMSETETSHGQVMVQYREQLMPLIPFSSDHQFKETGRQPILVFTDRERSMGLVVDEIVDIVDDRLKIELTTDIPGLIGSAVIAKKATDVIDAGYFLTQAFSDWFGSSENAALEVGPGGRRRALLIDDSPFFRNLLTPLLSVAGWQVTALDSAQAALEMRDRGAAFDVIISDIEMPGMNGFEFANEVRSGGSWSQVPMVALSAHATSADFERGRSAGFNDYVAKFDREALVSSLAQTVAGAASGGTG
ncbi:MAG: chemotaxis protein CheW [Rhodospirillales bacterium]